MSDPGALSQLLDAIRGDAGWRERIAALEAGAGPATDRSGRRRRLAAAIAAADSVVPIQSGSPILGDALARFRARIHAEIRIYQDRQTTVNRELADALGQIDDAIDTLVQELEPLGEVRIRLEALEMRLEALERR